VFGEHYEELEQNHTTLSLCTEW